MWGRIRLEDRIKEHLLAKLMQQTNYQKSCSIADYIFNTLHPLDQKRSFSIIFKARDRKTLKFVEAVAIRLFKPKLNVQQHMDYQLKLPWS